MATTVDTKTTTVYVNNIAAVDDTADRVTVTPTAPGTGPGMPGQAAYVFDCPRGTCKTGDSFSYVQTLSTVA